MFDSDILLKMSLILTLQNWPEYALLDCGEGQKLERLGKYTLVTPFPKAIWSKSKPDIWRNADMIYERNGEAGGKWVKNLANEDWSVKWKDLTFRLKPTSFKHTGVFPEQMGFWTLIEEKIKKSNSKPKILNLFAYTGITTTFCAKLGAHVTHVDSSKDIITWAAENAKLSDVPEENHRWIIDDAMKFVQREVSRGTKYDAIIMDPPKFGRGNKGQVWKIEEDLQKLLQLCEQILVEKPLFVLINTYSTDLSSISLKNLALQSFKNKFQNYDHGELVLKQEDSEIILPMSIFAFLSN